MIRRPPRSTLFPYTTLFRSFTAPERAKAFLRPELERLSDPLAWADMSRAVGLVAGAVRAGVPVLVHGDYDVDGQCAAAMLTRVLQSVGGKDRKSTRLNSSH